MRDLTSHVFRGHGVEAALTRSDLFMRLLSRDYLPHRYCYRADPGLVWTNVISDASIAASYVLIFLCLLWVANKLRRLPQLRGFIWIFVAFGTFILSCAVTHMMEVITVWLPFYPLSATLKAVCAAVSVPTAFFFFKAAPGIVANISRFFDLLSMAQRGEQDALKEANTRTALATESCGIGIWDWDLRTGTLNCDALMHKIIGMEPEECKRFDFDFWTGRVHPADRAPVEQALQDCVHGIRPYNTEFRTVWDDGSVHFVKATGKAIRDQNGIASRMVGTNMDITASKLAEQELRDQANILDLSHDGIMVRELNGKILFWNNGAEEMYGYSKEDAIGSISHDLLRTVFPRPLPEIESELKQNKRWEGQLGHTTRDGAIVFVESRWVLQTIGEEIAWRVMETDNDVTERRRAEEASLRNIQALTRSNQELDHFAYAASHDLKAPLRVIQNVSTWIEEDLEKHLTAETRENMNLLRSRVKRMDKLLDDLLQYSRIGRETDKGHNEVISGAALIDNILGLLAPPPDFIIDASSTFAGIEVFRMPLQQVLINLISNALKHHDKKSGRIDISVEDIGAMFRFSVKDDGPGIAVEYHEQIFKMFQTLKPRDQVEGSGMGLAMVRKHVDVAGGELHLKSSVGQGSTFSFTWPKQLMGAKDGSHEFDKSGEAI